MMRLHAALLALIVSVLALAPVGCGDGEAGGTAESSQAHNLYVQTADGGTVKRHAGKLTLTLHEVAPTTTTFTDRPERRSGAISTASFANGFPAFFGGDPPNADLSSLRIGKGEFTVELTNPRYTRGADTLSYDIRPVGRDGRRLPARLGPLSLFIDVGGSSWDTRLHLLVATDGDFCQSNGFGKGSPLSVAVENESDILTAPATWIVEPQVPLSYPVEVTGDKGILYGGTQVAEGAHKNGGTTMVIDWTLQCKDPDGVYVYDVTKVRTAASVPDSNFESNTARCVLLEADNQARLDGTVIGYPGALDFECNAYADIGFHTTAYFKIKD